MSNSDMFDMVLRGYRITIPIVLEKQPDFEYKSSMSTLTEIERAAAALPLEQQESLFEWLSKRMRNRGLNGASPHSVLDIAPVSLGAVIRPLGPDDDLLGEMLEK